jgi:hypothetical protein
MATQEERLGKVELSLDLFKTETVKAYQDLTMEFVMVKGLIEDSVKRSMMMRKQIEEVKNEINGEIAEVRQDIHTLEQGIETFKQSVNERFETQDQKLDQVLIMLSKLTPGTQQGT